MIRPFSPDAKIALLRQGLSMKPHSPTIMLRLAEALAEKGETKEAAKIFRRAYLQKPFLWFGRPGGNPEDLRDEAAAMIEHGAIFSSTIAALAIGEARLGHADEVKRLVDYDRFFRTRCWSRLMVSTTGGVQCGAGGRDQIQFEFLPGDGRPLDAKHLAERQRDVIRKARMPRIHRSGPARGRSLHREPA